MDIISYVAAALDSEMVVCEISSLAGPCEWKNGKNNISSLSNVNSVFINKSCH